MKNKLYIVALVAVLALGAWGCNKRTGRPESNTNVSTVNTNAATSATSANQQSASQAISYQGEEGKTALVILKQRYQVETREFAGVGEFVQSINGVKPDDKHFWSFYVNGQPSSVGAGQYQTKPTDKIEWKLEPII